MAKKIKLNKKTIIIGAKIIAALVSLILALQAFLALSGVTESFHQMVDTMKEKPITDMTFVKPGDSCALNYEALVVSWPRTSQLCDCRSSTDSKLRSATPTPAGYNLPTGVTGGTCSNSSKNAGCKNIDIPGKNLTLWRGKKLCFLRSGFNSYTHPNRVVKVGEDCPKDSSGIALVNCTGGTSSTGYTTCVYNRADCPITEVVVKAGNEAGPSGTGWVSQYLDSTPNGTLYFRRGAGLPFKWFSFQPGQQCWPANAGIQYYKNKVERKDRFMGSSIQTVKNCTTGKPEDKFEDNRWVPFDYYNEKKLYEDNRVFGANLNTSAADYAMWMPPDSGSVDWQLNFMTDILWVDGCPSTRVGVAGETGAVDTMRSAQLALLIILVVVTLVSAFYYNYKDCVAETEEESKAIKKKQKPIEIAASIFKFPAVLVALIIAWLHKGWFSSVSGATCSDKSTNAIFTYFSGILDSTSISNIFTLLMIVVGVALFLYGEWKAAHPSEEEQREEPLDAPV